MTPLCELEPDAGMRPEAGYAWTLLRRHGRRPLGLRARALLHADNRCAGLGLWSSLAILETAQGRFATSLCHACPGGWDWQDAWLTDAPGSLRERLFDHDPLMAIPSHWHGQARVFLTAWRGLLAAALGLKAPGSADAG